MNGKPTTALEQLERLPRPVYGHVEAVSNVVIQHQHSHPWIQLAYAARGVLDVWTKQGRFVAPPHRAVWIPAGTPHRVYCGTDTQIRSLYIEPNASQRATDECCVLEVSQLLRELIRTFSEFPEKYEESGPQGRLVDVLLDQLALAPTTDLMLPLPKDPRLAVVCRYLQKHPDSQKSLAQWAAQLDVSTKTLSRLFIKETGMGFRKWRQRLRLLAALPLLEQGQRVTDVALASGYETPSAFTAAFKEQFGATPGELFQFRSRKVSP